MAMKNTLGLFACLSLCLVSSSCFADKPDKPIRLHVQISNNTHANCRMLFDELLHGIYDSAPPQSIMVGDAKSFDMEQISIFGMEATLAYQCGNNIATFQVEQDFSMYIGTTPYIRITKTQGIQIVATAISSSLLFWESPGILNIALQDYSAK
jgi:hypothetical protein